MRSPTHRAAHAMAAGLCALLPWMAHASTGTSAATPTTAGTSTEAARSARTPGAASCPPLLQHTVPRLQDEKPQPLCQYAGKVLLIVNTASACGFTPQFEGLEALNAAYAARGL
ncbi:MAG: glutathione peroxidase, partial [Rubrivivax sp.]